MSDFFLYERYENYEKYEKYENEEESVFYICSLDENCDCDDCIPNETENSENPEVEEPVFLEKLENFVVNMFNAIFDNEDEDEEYFYEFNP